MGENRSKDSVTAHLKLRLSPCEKTWGQAKGGQDLTDTFERGGPRRKERIYEAGASAVQSGRGAIQTIQFHVGRCRSSGGRCALLAGRRVF